MTLQQPISEIVLVRNCTLLPEISNAMKSHHFSRICKIKGDLVTIFTQTVICFSQRQSL